MSIQEHNLSTDPKSVCIPNSLLSIDVQTASTNGLQKKEHGFSGDEFSLKVRKPYTITKQREKWTEEEHNKFLEALQLYGRAWRRIEEHIGTKTAVQIRSHAQKFFSKVVRESASNGTGNVKPIEIPPPRPKRKPVHPYPRKMGNPSSNGNLTIGKLGQSSFPVLSGSEQGNGSPTSVLSAFGSDTMSSFFSNPPTSPVSSGAGSNEQETLTEEHNKAPSLGQRNASSSEQKQNHSSMELDLHCGSHTPSKEAEAAVPCLKLFGRTVMVTDLHKPFSPGAGNGMQNSESPPNASIERQDKSPCRDIEVPSLPRALQGDFVSPSKDAWMLPMFYPLPSNYGEAMNPTEPRLMPLPWWALCGSLPLQFLHQQSSGPEQLSSQPCADASNDNAMQHECSWTGSNSASAAVGGHTDSSKCTELGRSKKNADNAAKDNACLSSRIVGSDESGRGFLPYKRCVVEREMQHPQGMNDEGKGQSIGLCL